MFLNGEELINIALDEIEATLDNPDIDYSDMANRIRAVVEFVNRMRKKKQEDRDF